MSRRMLETSLRPNSGKTSGIGAEKYTNVAQVKFEMQHVKSDSSIAKMFGQINELRHEEFDEDHPDRYSDNICGRIVQNRRFELLCLGVIVLNAGMIGVNTEFETRDPLRASPPMFVQVFEHLFTVFFTTEIGIRLAAHRKKLQCLTDRWFLFDSSLVSLMILENWILAGQGGQGYSVLRLMRLLRITRMARIMRAMPELVVILKGLVAALRAVACTGLLMGLVLYVWAVLFTTVYHQGRSSDDAFGGCDLQWYFGSFGKSMFTLFVMGTLLDDITPCIWVVRKKGSVFMAGLLILFILVASFNILNTLVGVLVEVVCATGEGEMAKMRDTKFGEDIKTIFEQMDTRNCGYISRMNFYEMRHHEKVLNALEELGIDEEHFELFGELLFREGQGSENADDCNLSFPRLLAMMTMLRPGTAANALEFALFRKKVTEGLKAVKNNVVRISESLQPAGRTSQTITQIGQTGMKSRLSGTISADAIGAPSLSQLLSQFDEHLVISLVDSIAALRKESNGEVVATVLEAFAELERVRLPIIQKEVQFRCALELAQDRMEQPLVALELVQEPRPEGIVKEVELTSAAGAAAKLLELPGRRRLALQQGAAQSVPSTIDTLQYVSEESWPIKIRL